jgi:hypothetical protein
MPASYSAAFPHPPELGAERFVVFSFPVTWSFLSRYSAPDKSELQPDPKSPFATTLSPVEIGPIASRAEPLAAPGPADAAEISALARVSAPENPSSRVDRWGMVIPRMSRPAAPSPRKLATQWPGAQTATEDPRQPAERYASAPETTLPSAGVAPRALAMQSEPRPTTVQSVLTDIAAELGVRPPQFELLGRRRVQRPVMSGSPSLVGLLAAKILVYFPNKRSAVPAPIVWEPGRAISVGPALWTGLSEWPRRVSVVPGSTDLKNFRLDFQGQIDSKALGWAFRVKDPKNFYAMKLEIVKPGPESSVVLKRFAVVDGHDQRATQVPLVAGFQPRMVYKIRTEAIGNTFTTWVLDRKIDEWTDASHDAGGVGLYRGHGEYGTVVGDFVVRPLAPRARCGAGRFTREE